MKTIIKNYIFGQLKSRIHLCKDKETLCFGLNFHIKLI